MNNDISILHITECLGGGVERYVQMILPRLKQRGFRQYFICTQRHDASLYQDVVDEVRQLDISQTFSPFKVWRSIKAIRKEIRRLRPDVVYCHSSFAGGLGRLAAMGMPCKVVYNPHGWAFNMK